MTSRGSLFGSWIDFQTERANRGSCKKCVQKFVMRIRKGEAVFYYQFPNQDDSIPATWSDAFPSAPACEAGKLFGIRTRTGMVLESAVLRNSSQKVCVCVCVCVCDHLRGLVVKSSWLRIQRSGFDFRHYQIFSEVVGLEQGPLTFVSTTEELLGRKSSGSGLENPRIRP
jgi:hypothetical protein